MEENTFKKGLIDGLPIGIGYFSVAFAFGIFALRCGLKGWQAVAISATNLTSAGQIAAVPIIAVQGSLVELASTQLVINMRYFLMSVVLSQKLKPETTVLDKLIIAWCNTDEIFAVASAQPEPLTPAYMYGIEIVSIFGWTLGTALGAIGGSLLPLRVTAALGLMLYGMFIAIIIPPAKKNFRVLIVILLSAGMSVIVKFFLTFISDGFAVIICAVVSSVICALIFPHKTEQKEADA